MSFSEQSFPCWGVQKVIKSCSQQLWGETRKERLLALVSVSGFGGSLQSVPSLAGMWKLSQRAGPRRRSVQPLLVLLEMILMRASSRAEAEQTARQDQRGADAPQRSLLLWRGWGISLSGETLKRQRLFFFTNCDEEQPIRAGRHRFFVAWMRREVRWFGFSEFFDLLHLQTNLKTCILVFKEECFWMYLNFLNALKKLCWDQMINHPGGKLQQHLAAGSGMSHPGCKQDDVNNTHTDTHVWRVKHPDTHFLSCHQSKDLFFQLFVFPKHETQRLK